MQSLPHSFIHTTPFCLFLECREGTALQEIEGRIDIHLAFKRFVGMLRQIGFLRSRACQGDS